MRQGGLRPHQQRMPPALNIIALATFAASLSARALDPVLPYVASDFRVSIATAAGFASVFAFTFAIAYGFGIQNVGKISTLLTAAAVMVALGLACARLLRPTRPKDAAMLPNVQP
jgi:predicted MFS family arabinose efflux permease